MKRKINFIVIHCSAGFGDLASIKKFWKDTLKWKTGGYHRWVDLDGGVTDLYDLDVITNGVKGFNNHSVHISYRGGVDKNNVNKALDTRTEAQKESIITSIKKVLEELKKYQSINHIKILGHRDFSKDQNGNGIVDSWERIKECPSYEVKDQYQWLLK